MAGHRLDTVRPGRMMGRLRACRFPARPFVVKMTTAAPDRRPSRPEDPMRYLLLIYGEEPTEAAPDDVMIRQTAAYDAFTGWSRERGLFRAGEALQPTAAATTVRVREGRTLRDRRAVRRDEGGARRLLPHRGRAISTRRSTARPGSPGRATARSRSGRSWSCRRARPPRPLAQPADPRAVVDRLFREESGRAVATLIRLTGDFDLAEDAVQEAFIVALERWPRDGLPAEPGRLDHDHRPEPGDRPAAPGQAPGRQGGPRSPARRRSRPSWPRSSLRRRT